MIACVCRMQNGVRLRVRLSPKAKREGVEGLYVDSEGSEALKIAVNAPPVDGQANKAVIVLLSKLWKIPKSSFKIVTGQTDRNKTLAIEGDADALFKQLVSEVEKCRK